LLLHPSSLLANEYLRWSGLHYARTNFPFLRDRLSTATYVAENKNFLIDISNIITQANSIDIVDYVLTERGSPVRSARH